MKAVGNCGGAEFVGSSAVVPSPVLEEIVQQLFEWLNEEVEKNGEVPTPSVLFSKTVEFLYLRKRQIKVVDVIRESTMAWIKTNCGTLVVGASNGEVLVEVQE